MKRLVLIAAALLASLFSPLAKASSVSDSKTPSVIYQRLWLEHGVTKDGKKGMKVHVKFNITGMKGKQCLVLAYFESPKGTGVKDTNGDYSSNTGTVCTSAFITPGYDDTTYNDLSLFIPAEEIHMKPGENTYYTRIAVKGPEGSFISPHSEYVSFRGKVEEKKAAQKSSGNDSMSQMMNSMSSMMGAMMSGNTAAFNQAYSNGMNAASSVYSQGMKDIKRVYETFSSAAQDGEWVLKAGAQAQASGIDYSKRLDEQLSSNRSSSSGNASSSGYTVGTYQAKVISNAYGSTAVSYQSTQIYKDSYGYYIKVSSSGANSYLRPSSDSSFMGVDVSGYNYVAGTDRYWFFRL